MIVLVPLVAEAATAPHTFRELSSQVVQIISAATATLIIAALVAYLWGIASNFEKLSEGDMNKYRDFILWGIAILFVMVSIWGIIKLLQSTVFSAGAVNNAATGGQDGGNSGPCTFTSCPPGTLSI